MLSNKIAQHKIEIHTKTALKTFSLCARGRAWMKHVIYDYDYECNWKKKKEKENNSKMGKKSSRRFIFQLNILLFYIRGIFVETN